MRLVNEIILFNEVRRSVIITLGKMVNYISKRSLFEKLSLNDQDNMLVFVIDNININSNDIQYGIMNQ